MTILIYVSTFISNHLTSLQYYLVVAGLILPNFGIGYFETSGWVTREEKGDIVKPYFRWTDRDMGPET
jgi:hypothetical protein